jgi:molybdopterin converting factor small subunit
LLEFTEGQRRLELKNLGTVGAVLSLVPSGVRRRVLDERGTLRPHVNVFVGDTSIRETGQLDTPLRDGDEVFIIPAVSGGARAVGQGIGGRDVADVDR